ncbi:MAG: hypothetical protein IT204_14405 [Fimbriimonadaceae bacterium]|nr:hypothetical protein [Fimbriimonadaceae bacterium]
MADPRVPGRTPGLTLLALALTSAWAATTVADDFQAGWDRWQPVTASNWELRRDGDNQYLALIKPGALRTGVRRPGEYVLLKDQRLQDTTLTARVQSLRPTTLKGRDVVLVFGWQDDTHFYYTHLSNDTNGSTHNVIMKVDGEQRTALQTPKKPEARLSDGWHTARLRHQPDGQIEVFFDDLEKPLMTARDTAWPAGRVGFGTFDDTAAFDDVAVAGTPAVQ